MSTFADALATERAVSRGYQDRGCQVRQALDRLPDNDRDAAQAALDNPDIEGSAIARAFTTLGERIPPYTVQRHRRGDCRCPR